MKKKITVAEVVKKVTKNKPVSVISIQEAINTDPELKKLGIKRKDINNFLFNEYYDDTKLYQSCETFERIL